jgi:hypothetical protein
MKTAAVLSIVGALTTAGAATGAAAAAIGSPYDYSNPQTTGCAADGQSIASYPIRSTVTNAVVGTLEVRYSPSCDTNWVRANNTVPGATVHKYIERHRTHLPTSGTLPYASQTESDTALGWSYGMQFGGAAIACVGVGAWFTDSSGAIIATAGPMITLC